MTRLSILASIIVSGVLTAILTQPSATCGGENQFASLDIKPIQIPRIIETQRSILLTQDDFNDAGKSKLADAGFRHFSLELMVQKKPKVETISQEEFQKRMDDGETVIFFVGDESVDLTKYPKGVFVEGIADELKLKPGVYEGAAVKRYEISPIKTKEKTSLKTI